MTERQGQWLIDIARDADAYLRSLPVSSLGPAARRLLNVPENCPSCGRPETDEQRQRRLDRD